MTALAPIYKHQAMLSAIRAGRAPLNSERPLYIKHADSECSADGVFSVEAWGDASVTAYFDHERDEQPVGNNPGRMAWFKAPTLVAVELDDGESARMFIHRSELESIVSPEDIARLEDAHSEEING